MPNKHAGNDGNLCRNCAKLIDIGRDLLRANKIILKPETLSHFGLMLEIRKKDDSSFGSIINEFKPRYPLMFLPYVAPWKDEAHGELKTFEEIADTSAGANKVAMFKADIDNLGLVFSSSMGEGKDNGMVTVIAITATVVCSTLFGFGGMSGVEFIQFFLWTYFNQTLYHLAYAALFTMLAFISRNAAMTILLGVGWTVVEMMVIGFLGNYQGGSLAFARQIFPGLYIGIFYSVEYDLYWYNNATQIIKGIATSMLFIGASSITGITLFLKNDIK
jgi:hypothetical protein